MIKFKVILTDCPWKYGFQRYKKNSGCDYPTMTTEELCKLPVGQIADDNSLLFHWVLDVLCVDKSSLLSF